MKRLLVSLILALSLALPAAAQVVEDPSTGASISSGSTISGCNAITAILNVVTGALTCNPASVVNGTVSTAGRSILTIRDTISGSSATSNFLNVTGTFPGTLSAETNGVYFSLTGDNDTQAQYGFRTSLAALGNSTNAAIYGDISGATCGANLQCSGVLGVNTSTDVSGIGTRAGGLFQSTGSTGAARNFGVIGAAYNSNSTTGSAYGGWFTASNNAATQARAMGVIGQAWSTATVAIGGYFGFQTNPNTSGETTGGLPAPTGVAALIADNGAVAANIFQARDNGTAVLTVADGGATTFTQDVTVSTNKLLSVGGGLGGLATYTIQTPDSLLMTTGAASNSAHLLENADAAAFDFNNGRCGVSACTDPALVIHSHNQATNEYVQLSHDGTLGHLDVQATTQGRGQIALGGVKDLTESAATVVVDIPVASGSYSGATIDWTVVAQDATDFQSRHGSTYVAAVNKAGTETCSVGDVGTTVVAVSVGTLTVTTGSDTTGSNVCTFTINAVSSLTQTSLRVLYTVIMQGVGIPTAR